MGAAACHPEKSPEDTGRKGHLTRALGGEPETLDPRLAEDNASLALVGDLYEGLIVEGPDGKLRPGAAERWTVDSTGMQWTFHLHPDLRWSDGSPLAAEHFAAGLDEARRPGTEAPYGELLKAVRRVTASTRNTLTVELDAPLPELPAILALPLASPKPQPSASDPTVSNGPYRLVERRPGERVELERNPHFHDAANVAIARVTYLTLEDLNTELNLYRTGQLDVTSEVPNAQLEWIRRNLARELHVSPYLSTYAYAINLERLPDRDARSALAMALDREQVTRMVTGAGETPAFGWVPDGMPGYQPARFEWRGEANVNRETQARTLWDRARTRPAARDRLVLCTDASANHHRTAVALADQWHRVLGVTIELREMEWKAYLATRDEPGDCDLLRFGWSADYVDPAAFLVLLRSGHAQNTFRFSSPRYDALLDAANASLDPQQRLRLLAVAEAQLLADVPLIPVFHRVSKRLVKPYVHGVTDNPLGHLPSRYLTLVGR
jgi:oligopeptide transport system substrate-binding protein